MKMSGEEPSIELFNHFIPNIQQQFCSIKPHSEPVPEIWEGDSEHYTEEKNFLVFKLDGFHLSRRLHI